MKKLRGVVAATVLPFSPDGSIDWASYGRLLAYCADPKVSAVFVNGHAGECTSLSAAERAEVIRYTKRICGADKPVLAGIAPNTWSDGIAQAQEARSAGADCAVLFPLPSFQGVASAGPAAPVAYVRAVADAVDMPISIFQYPLSTGFGYSMETLVAIASIRNVCMIKEGSGDPAVYAEVLRRVRAAAPHVSMMPTNIGWIMAQVAIGGDGILSGFASLAPAWLAELWQAAEAKDLGAMRQADDRMNSLLRIIYEGPRMDVHTRIKSALHHMGVIECAIPRPPLLPLAADAEHRIARAVDASGLTAH